MRLFNGSSFYYLYLNTEIYRRSYIFTENTYKIPIESGTFGISPIPGAMWFLTTIFFIEAIYIVLDRLLNNKWQLHFAVVILVAFGMVAPTILRFRLPWALDASFVGIGFFHFARVIHGTKAEMILNLRLWQAVLIGFVFSCLIMICPKINMRTGSYGWYLPLWINTLGAIVAGWNLAKYMEHLLMHGKTLRVIFEWIKVIGRNSIVYLCLNQVIILLITKLLDMIAVNGIIAKLPVLILTIIFLFGFEKLICNTRLKIIIGRKNG